MANLETDRRMNHAIEGEIIESLAYESLKERKRARRWGIFFKLFFSAYLLVILLAVFIDRSPVSVGRHTALVDVQGVIAANGDVTADTVTAGLQAAFENDNAAGVIVRINSPGGSPVQAGYINDEIQRLRMQHPDRPIYAVVSDICASGGYYVAVAADKIFANRASIVGSIGVLMDGFGFVGTMEKLGVERRLIIAGEHKAMLDPFSPEDSVGAEHAQKLVDKVHQQFIKVVREGRGNRLVDREDIFSGLFWTGEEALELGLVDEMGSTGYVAREVIGAEKIVDYTQRESWMELFAKEIGASLANILPMSLLQRNLSLK
ncbi:MAG: S49 family peptidase [Gammaproteobacteria bacterium]|nr:S49 family peptidase [Gammaproteobacteria bacterium]